MVVAPAVVTSCSRHRWLDIGQRKKRFEMKISLSGENKMEAQEIGIILQARPLLVPWNSFVNSPCPDEHNTPFLRRGLFVHWPHRASRTSLWFLLAWMVDARFCCHTKVKGKMIITEVGETHLWGRLRGEKEKSHSRLLCEGGRSLGELGFIREKKTKKIWNMEATSLKKSQREAPCT